MTIHPHDLTGCAPAPLAHYLKALGILRLVAEQADPHARGWWQDEHFCLLTRLDRQELERFFLEQYSPTPFVSPWNKGSGFYRAEDPGLAPLEKSQAARFGDFRKGIEQAKALLKEVANADAAIRAIKSRTKTNKAFQSAEQRTLLKRSHAFIECRDGLQKQREKKYVSPDQQRDLEAEIKTLDLLISEVQNPPTKAEVERLKNMPGYKRVLACADRHFKSLKATLIPDCRRAWRGKNADWLSAAVVLDSSGDATWPSLLGTGGNDGNLDYTNNAMQRLGEMFRLDDPQGHPREHTTALLRDALWSEPSKELTDNAIGQFLPGSAGGANSTTAADGSPLVNPWDFILMLEGAILFSARATRRLDPQSSARASAPFVLYAHAAGYSSPGDEKSQRGEQWMPLWARPTILSDLTALLGEARLQLARQTANRPVDAARAIARLGVARGIDAFTRYGYLERNGQSNLAVCLGRIHVCHRPRGRLIDDLGTWMDRLHYAATPRPKYTPPARLVHAERRLADAVFAVLTHDDSPDRWQAVLLAAVAVECIQAAGTAIEAGPIPPLDPDWVKAANDNSPEFRLALALGSAASDYSRQGRPFDPIRHHWLPLERGARRFQVHDKRLAHDPRVVMTGRDALADCAALVQRRLIEARMPGTRSQRRLPLIAAAGCSAHLTDLAHLLAGSVDVPRVLDLARAFMALRWERWTTDAAPRLAGAGPIPDEAWLALRLACLPWPLDKNRDIPAEPGMIRRLPAGDATGAVGLALSRLHASGLRPPLQSAFADPPTARLWAAALAFPIDHGSARRAAALLAPNSYGDHHD
ncbi:MAG: type I-U CRISPR-associated protein Csx17 [Planctomycetota bacterium]|nr:type I-U CRISPR-associated protein Csx17 [Planctomycetota bacterium]